MKYTKFLLVFALFCLSYAMPAQAVDLTVYADTPSTGNCVPFGGTPGLFAPYGGFAYKNLPAFELAAGDSIAFDLGHENDYPIELDIEMAIASPGTDIAISPFTKVVSNTQQAAKPKGDEIVGNYELAFLAEQPFSFPGGGLIIRFSNPGPDYLADGTCSGVMVYGDPADTSGFFVSRFYQDADGLAPYDGSSLSVIGTFKLSAARTDYVALGPCRLFDTRDQTEGRFAAGETRDFFVWSEVPNDSDIVDQGGSDNCVIPREAVAIQINLTAVNPGGFGYLRAWRAGLSAPVATLMTWPSAGTAISNTTSVPVSNSLGQNLSVKIYASSTHLVGDVVGYYVLTQ